MLRLSCSKTCAPKLRAQISSRHFGHTFKSVKYIYVYKCETMKYIVIFSSITHWYTKSFQSYILEGFEPRINQNNKE